MNRHDEMIFTSQPRNLSARYACQTVGAQINPGRTQRIRRVNFLGAITILVVLGASEARAQTPNAILKIEFGLDNAANTTAPKSVGDFQFAVSKLGEAPFFKFHGSEQVITVPVSATSVHNAKTTFVLSNVKQPAGYGPFYQGDCDPAGRIDLRSVVPVNVPTTRVRRCGCAFLTNKHFQPIQSDQRPVREFCPIGQPAAVRVERGDDVCGSQPGPGQRTYRAERCDDLPLEL